MFVKAIFHVPDDKAEIIRGTDKERERVGSCAGGLFATLVRHNINIDKKSLHIETPHLGRRELIKVLRLATPHLGQNS